jgi:hypothetical protein
VTARHARSPRNHARRVEELQDLERRGLLRFVESRRPDDDTGKTRPWEYVVHVQGDPEPVVLPTGKVDSWLAGLRAALTALAHRAHDRISDAIHHDRAGHAPHPTEDPREQ